MADSLGSMNKKYSYFVQKFQKYWKGPMGVHAHDNLNNALQNSLALKKNGIEWIDSTITGMGRGPGNTKSEEIVKSFKKILNIHILIISRNILIISLSR